MAGGAVTTGSRRHTVGLKSMHTVALGWVQTPFEFFFQLLKNRSNFVIQIACFPEFQKCSNFA
jgi:hypothetical protein